MNAEERKELDKLIGCYVNLGHDKDFKDKIIPLIERAEKEGYDKAIAMFKLKIGFHGTLKSFYKRTNEALAEMESKK